jgi:hypothetical protein
MEETYAILRHLRQAYADLREQGNEEVADQILSIKHRLIDEVVRSLERAAYGEAEDGIGS